MKHLFIFFAVLSFAACNSKRGVIQDFIVGTYESKGETELSKAVVHLTIEKLDDADNHNYLVKYQRSFQQKINGEWTAAQTESTNIPMTFNASTNQLEDPIKNKIITFFPEKNTLMLNQGKGWDDP